MRLSILIRIAVLSSLAAVLMSLQVPLFTPYLKYDPSEVPALIGTFALGPLYGALIVLLKNALFLLTHFAPTELVGLPLNSVAGLTLTLVSGSLYQMRKTKQRAVLSLCLGVVAMTLLMIPANMLLLPVFQSLFMPSAVRLQPDELMTVILLTVTPFNLVKGSLTSIITFVIYKRFSAVLKSEPLWEAPLVPGANSTSGAP